MRLVVVVSKPAAQHDPAIRLNKERSDEAIRARAEIDQGVNRAIAVQAGEAVTGDTVASGELAAQDDAGVGLDRDGGDHIISADAWSEGSIHRAAGG